MIKPALFLNTPDVIVCAHCMLQYVTTFCASSIRLEILTYLRVGICYWFCIPWMLIEIGRFPTVYSSCIWKAQADRHSIRQSHPMQFFVFVATHFSLGNSLTHCQVWGFLIADQTEMYVSRHWKFPIVSFVLYHLSLVLLSSRRWLFSVRLIRSFCRKLRGIFVG